RDHTDDRVVDGRPCQRVTEGDVRVVLAGGSLAEGDVRVERGVLVTRRGLDGRDDLPRDAELGEASKRRVLVGPEVPNRLVKADETFLDQILGLAARDEIRARLEPDEARVTADERIERAVVAVARAQDK